MGKFLKTVCSLFVCAFLVVPFANVSAEDVKEVGTYEELVAALNEGGIVTLKNDIEVTAPIITNKDITLNGAGFELKATYTGTSGNQTIITSGSGTLTLKNIKLIDSPKYGVQSYNGGNVVLDDVTINNNSEKYGAVLINGGTVTVKSLTMANNSYGIEFAVGVNVTGTPALIMDGEIKGNQKDPIYVDVDQVKELNVTNTETSKQKISLKDNTIVLTDGEKVVATSNILPNGTVVDVDGTKMEAVEPTVTPENPDTDKDNNQTTTKDEIKNPNTSDNILFIIGTLAVSVLGIIISKKQLARN